VRPIDRLRPGDRIVVRPQEIVPADAILLDERAEIDYAFITGEQTPVPTRFGGTVRAGGRVVDRAIRLRVLRETSHSQLARFWSKPACDAKPFDETRRWQVYPSRR
jgi:Cu+-exporting ATPase